MEPVLMTERLVLRPFTPADADGLLAMYGDPEVMRFLGPHVRSLDEVESEVLPLLLETRYSETGLEYLAADTRADGQFIGWFGLRPVRPADAAMVHWRKGLDETRTGSVGYRLRRGAWGRGYATEGTRALIARAFTEFDLAEVVATTMAVNVRSRRVMEKAGLRYARTIHVSFDDPLAGTEHGEVEYRLRRADWNPVPDKISPTASGETAT
jgi:RimJ/RimL family protein N-acetyltransferase